MTNLDTFVQAYVACALWSSNDENGNSFEYLNHDADDIDPKTLTSMRSDCADFMVENHPDLELACERPGYTITSAGHDFWLTRNRHGAGFWDRGLGDVGQRLSTAAKIYGSVDLYLDDDGKVHAS